jgi:hypothetical protein
MPRPALYSQHTPAVHPGCTRYTPAVHPGCTRYTPVVHPGCTRYTPVVHPGCTRYTPVVHPGCSPHTRAVSRHKPRSGAAFAPVLADCPGSIPLVIDEAGSVWRDF